MEKLVRGFHHFQNAHFNENKDLFERLSLGQQPDTLMITCSDSRISPGLVLQTKPGELFILRNAGNIVPPYGALHGGEAATVEYAIKALNIAHIVVMGHSHCGAMKGLVSPEILGDMSSVAEWLGYASTTQQIVASCYPDLQGEDLLNAAIKENVLTQLDHLRTHPAVAVGLAKGTLMLHGWIYEIESGKILAFDPGTSRFTPVLQQKISAAVASRMTAERLSVSADGD
ncbi:MAG: carbonic anhydrase [Acidobacteriota bacterium]|nr:MAG: carbonic anhydrase [Acidobacteriota bacterium]